MAIGNSTDQPTLWETGEPLKRCNRCKQAKPLDEMYIEPARRGRRRRYCSICRECHRKVARQWQLDHPQEAQENKRRYDRARILREREITDELYTQMLLAQDSKCAICHQPETIKRQDGTPRAIALDHDHATGRVREFLCHYCNKGLGSFRDSPALLRAAADYLDKHRK